MTNTPIAAVLPVGEFDSGPINSELDDIIRTLRRLGMKLLVADPVADEENARLSIKTLSKKKPDILIIIPLRGLSAQTIEAAALASHVPCMIFPVQGRFALPSSALAVGALRESDIPVELLYVPHDHPDTIEKLRCITRAAGAFSQIRKSRIGIIGGLFPNLVSCSYDPQVVNARLGITLLPISFETIRNTIQSISTKSKEIERARQEIIRTYTVNSADESALNTGIKLHLALKQVALKQEIDGFATECWSAFPKEIGLNPCMGFIEDAYTLACEGDVMLCVSLLILRHLSGSRAYVGDLYDLDPEGILTLVHCGAPASLAADKSRVVLAKSPLALERGFETMTCRPELDHGPVTTFRFYGRECDRLHLASGELLYSEQSPSLAIKIKINGNRWDFLDQCFGNHYVVAAGDIRKELKQFCKWMKITIFET